MIVPLRSGGVGKGRSLLLVALSGLPTLIGGVAGVLLGSISPVFIGFTLALAAGCMLYVTYYEILPQVTLMEKGRRPAGIPTGRVSVRLRADFDHVKKS